MEFVEELLEHQKLLLFADLQFAEGLEYDEIDKRLKEVNNALLILNSSCQLLNASLLHGQSVIYTTEKNAIFIDNYKDDLVYIKTDGDLENTNNAYGAISDIKLKENITDATDKLEDLMKVQIRNFNLIGKGSDRKQIGVIAQELEEVFPAMITESKDYETVDTGETQMVPTGEKEIIDTGEVDDEGNAITEEKDIMEEQAITERKETGETTKSVKYSVFVPMLIKALQEETEARKALELRVAALET